MIKAISLERWDKAQIAERKLHKMTYEEGIHHYRIAYSHNFRYLKININKRQDNIVEVGPADFPALSFIANSNSTIIEPMASDHLRAFCESANINLIKEPFEDPRVKINPSSEIWLFNILQHTIDPEFLIYKAKKAKTIRYFEPIDTDIEDYHPHSFTKDDFDKWFPDVNKYYNETDNLCFHNGPCCYGVYHNTSC